MNILTSYDEKVIEKNVESSGGLNPVVVAIEELAELQQELTKVLRENLAGDARASRERIAEEMADVAIMLEQLQKLFKNEKAVGVYIDYKIERLKLRLEDKGVKIND